MRNGIKNTFPQQFAFILGLTTTGFTLAIGMMDIGGYPSYLNGESAFFILFMLFSGLVAQTAFVPFTLKVGYVAFGISALGAGTAILGYQRYLTHLPLILAATVLGTLYILVVLSLKQHHH